MHKSIATSTILEHELSELRLLVERQTGVVLDCPTVALAARVSDFIEAQGLDSSTTLMERLRAPEQDPSILPTLLDGLVNTNTGFFRHPGALNALTRQVLPQLCTRKSADSPGPIRLWSAGCATGEETYSIAMAVCDAMNPVNLNVANNGNGSGNGAGKIARNGGIADSFSGTGAQAAPKLSSGCSIHIVGSDLLPRNIAAADRGVYQQSALEGLPPATIRNYFSKIGTPVVASIAADDDPDSDTDFAGKSQTVVSAHLLVKPRLRSLVTFNCMNLARPGYIGRFDCIFCMDVLPHFSRVQRLAILERLHLYLEPGGYLFLSQTERLLASNLNFRSETFDGYTFHRKPLAASAAYGR
ncbi:MAG TPA: CheR family methyltransferase [Candidatus Polarisedimenticolia bacterium]|nr:CheR family methyltransferase [Candidatus Polarisedimenticolia bacterium]